MEEVKKSSRKTTNRKGSKRIRTDSKKVEDEVVKKKVSRSRRNKKVEKEGQFVGKMQS